MKCALKVGVFFFCLDLLLFGYTGTEAQTKIQEEAQIAPRNQTLVIGRVTNNPKKHYKSLKPIVDYVSSKLKDLGIIQGSVLMAKDNQEMIRYLIEGKVDWVTETPFSAIIFSEATGAEIILRRWKKGVPDYYSIFITRKDNDINSLADLKGKKITFEDPGSTSAYFVPLALLRREGLDLVKIYPPKEKPPADKVGYAFAGGELNITTWVHKGLVEAGAYSNLDWEDPYHTPEVLKRDLKIIYQTKPFPRAVELIRKKLDPEIKDRIKEVLLKAHEDPEAKDALKAYNKTKRFDEFKGKAKEGLEEARRILGYIREELE